MAFNPFVTFQKNQKFWMAAILLVTMITFVFCTGTGGDIQDKLLNRFRSSGPAVFRVDGRSVSSYDLTKLRDQRNAVNEFMRRLCNDAVENINRGLQKIQEAPLPAEDKKKQEQQALMTELSAIKFVLLERIRQPRYFEGGVKFDDLLEFKLWLAQADKLNIRLLDEDVDFMTRMEFFSPRFEYLSDQQMTQAWWEARRRDVFDDAEMRRAITNEFRVRMARLAMLEMRPGYFFAKDPRMPIPDPGLPTDQRLQVSLARLADVFKEKRAEFDVTLIPIAVEDFKRIVAREKGPPPEEALQKLFEKYGKTKFDPTLPLPSFETPAEVKVEFIMADPTLPIYVAAARAKLLLDQTLPLVGNPMQSPLVTAARYGAFAAGKQQTAQDILDGLTQKKFDLYGAADLSATEFIWPLAAHLAERDPQAIASLVGNMAAGRCDPAQVLGGPALNGLAAWGAFLAEPTLRQPDLIQAGITAESKRRTLPSALVAVSGATGQPLDVAIAAFGALKQYELPSNFGVQFRDATRTMMGRLVLPLAIIEPDLDRVMEERTAEQWSSRNLMTIKRLLDRNMKPEAIKRIVNENVPRYNLTHVEKTKNFYNQYNIDKAPSLQPLRESYDQYYPQINAFEGRSLTPERMLKEGDFYKLFFGNDRFTSTSKYKVQPWPPDVYPSQMELLAGPGAPDRPDVAPAMLAEVEKFARQRANPGEGFRLLDRAQKPILFWRYDEKPPEFPQNLAAVRPRVIEAWETELAREKALPKAMDIASALQKNGEFPPPPQFISALAVPAQHRPLVLSKIAPLVPRTVGERAMGGQRDYFPYTLPKDTIVMPRDDMVKELLDLYDLKAPIEVKTKTGLTTGEPSFVKELNDLNKSLFDAVKKENPKAPQGKFVQILTNEPQSMYYVAVISSPPTANLKEFEGDVLQFAAINQFRFVDRFVTRAQQMLATDFHAAIVQQLCRDFNCEPPPPDSDVRKTFDKDDHGG